MKPKRIAIDSNIVNLIADYELVGPIQDAVAAGSMILVLTDIIRDEVAATRDREKMAPLKRVLDALPSDVVPTHGFVLDVSRLGGAQLDEGEVGGFRTSGRGAMRDALVGATAGGNVDVLVTEDRDLASTVKGAAPRVQVWGFRQFLEFVHARPEGGAR